MQLRFKPNTKQYDDILDTGYLRTLWKTFGPKYVNIAEKVTGLHFSQNVMVVRCGKFRTSISGIPNRRAIEIGTYMLGSSGGFEQVRKTDDALMCVLAHELGHRLLLDNDIAVADDAPRRQYEVHRQLYVVMYETLVEVFGADRAKQIFAQDARPHEPEQSDFHEAWQWAYDLSPTMRHELIAHLVEYKRLPG
jgi:hypothetical protein